jgi:hypothetical protein
MNIFFGAILFRYIGMAVSYIFIFSLLLFFSFVLLLGGWHGFLVGCFILKLPRISCDLTRIKL